MASPESLFAVWLAGRSAPRPVELQELLRAHPEEAEALRELHEQWLRLEEIRKRYGLAGSLSDRLQAVHGPEADPRIELERADKGDSTEGLIERLSDRTPATDRYRTEGEIGRGGMGSVLRIWDEDLRRLLAMKVLLEPESTASDEAPGSATRQLARFLEEAQVTAQLDHPGIVPVHELGLDSTGGVYFTMKLVQGRTLASVFDELAQGAAEWTQTRVLGLLVKVCEAMSYAHAKGVIHRDLKPDNVMVGRFGEVFVMDWGLAKILGREDERDLRVQAPTGGPSTAVRTDRGDHTGETPDSPLCTMDGDVVGTPAYMSPEQAMGRVSEMGPASDVYALGAMLYHLLAGQMPYVPAGTHPNNYAVWQRVQEGPPRPLVELAPETPAELVAICERAMQRDAVDRYPDVRALSADLTAYLEGRVVRTYETGAWAEARKWVQRNQPLAAALAAALMLLLWGLGTALVLRAEAQANLELARAAEQEARDNLTLARQSEGEATQRADDVLRLSALQDLEDLVALVDDLWPAHPERIAHYRSWLARAETLLAELPAHRAKREELRALALPLTEEERRAGRAGHPEAARLAELGSELEMRRRALARRRDEVSEPLPEVNWSEHGADASALNEEAWPLVDPLRRSFGDEPLGLVLATKALELASDDPPLQAMIGDTLAWAHFALGQDEEALAASRAALEVAGDEARSEYEGYLESLQEAVAAMSGAEAIAREEERLAEREEEHRLLLSRMNERRDWRFPTEHAEARWWNAQLTKLIEGLERLSAGLLAPDATSEAHGWSIPKRLAFAERLATAFAPGGEYATRWEAAGPALRAAYPGLDLEPQMGLVPIGPDPASGLWEFWHVATGSEPIRDEEGVLVPSEDMGIVLVLLPGGTFWMGAQREDEHGPNFYPEAADDEGPVHAVTLSPYFFSKYELTQGQWLRFSGRNPSYYQPPSAFAISLQQPVEHVSWDECFETLAHMDLDLPSEAQWESAARAGTQTPWWTGADRESLAERRAANLADQAAARAEARWPSIGDWPELEDGYAIHAPVGSFAPNPLGLHDVHGNVWEWCLDGFESGYYGRSREVDPVRPYEDAVSRVFRGGSFSSPASSLRSALRSDNTPTVAVGSLGVRPAKRIAR